LSANFDEIKQFAEEQFELANEGATVIRFAANAKSISRSEMLAEQYGSITANALVDNPKYEKLKQGYGKSVWSVVLAVDLRGSTSRAVEIGPKNTYLTMHTFLPTLINLVGSWDGAVVGLRGDGLIAHFGETEVKSGSYTDVSSEVGSRAAQDSVNCGKGMIEAVSEIINPLLESNGIRSDLRIGVGIDCGHSVVTRIGHLAATELTAYGPPVNNACKFSDQQNQIHVRTRVHELYPTGEGGRVKFRPIGGGKSGMIVAFPPDMHMLDRNPPKKPR
jgi:class 3 adenylate cyclase